MRAAAAVVTGVVEADRERANRLRGGLRHQRDDDAGVDAAREQGAERHVGREPHPHRVAHGLADQLEPLLVAARLKCGRRRRPVPLDAHALTLGDEHVPRRQTVDSH